MGRPAQWKENVCIAIPEFTAAHGEFQRPLF